MKNSKNMNKKPSQRTTKESEKLFNEWMGRLMKRNPRIGREVNKLINYIRQKHEYGYMEGNFQVKSWQFRYISKDTENLRKCCWVGAVRKGNKGVGITIAFIHPKELNEKYKKKLRKHIYPWDYYGKMICAIWLSEDELSKIPLCKEAIMSVIEENYFQEQEVMSYGNYL